MSIEAKNYSQEPRKLPPTRTFMLQDSADIACAGRMRPARRREIFIPEIQQSEKAAKERFFTSDWLKDEVERVKQQPLKTGETPWYHLAGTGFWVKEQVSQLVRNTEGVGREVFPDVLERELSKVKVDIEAFEDEYLKQMGSLRWNLAWEERNGTKRIVCPDYNNELWSAVTDKKEREGAVYETLFGDESKGTTGFEGWLRTAPVDSFAVMVSPKGWSGLTDSDGKRIRYPETQVYAIQKKEDGNLQGYTFRYDATIMQNEELQKKLGLAVTKEPDQKERLKNTLKNVALLTPESATCAEEEGRQPIKNFSDIVDLMQSVVGREVAYEGAGSPKTFDEIRDFLKNPDKFTKRHPLTEKLINRFQDYTRWRFAQGDGVGESTLEQDLQISLALTPLHLNKLYRDKEQGDQFFYTGDGVQGSISKVDAGSKLVSAAGFGMDYGRERDDLGTRPGCAGGGSLSTMGSSRKAETTTKKASEDYDFDHDGNCDKCGNKGRLGPCELCVSCDAELGGKGKDVVGLK